MLVRLLGPVDVVVGGEARPVNGLRRKAVLAVLGLAAGEVVSTDRLVDVVWDGRSSGVRLNTVQSHVSYLRRVLGNRDAIVARGSGYLLDGGAEATDVQVAARLIEQGRRETRPDLRAARLRAALELWRGRPLTDVAGLTWLDAEAERLATLHLDAARSLTEARLALGEHAELVPELAELVRQHPYREDLCGQLMLALYRTGRQAESLAVCRQMRGRLADELGIDAGPALQELEAAILRQDPDLDPPVPTRSHAAAGRAGPPRAAGDVPARSRRGRDIGSAGAAHPLPADARVFTGRAIESERIVAGAIAAAGQGPAMSVYAIDGMPGVGKTALAVHVAHRLADRFAQRPVFVDLHGHTAGRSPADPADVLASLLAADGFDARRLPAGVEARSALWRQRMAGRQLLLVLDNAAGSSQVAPLLPASPGSVVLVTSRRFLGDLPADAVAVPLDVLTAVEAEQMFVRLAPHAAIDPDGVAELAALCGYLPLAIALLARLLVRHRTWTVRDLVAETRARLVALAAEDRTVQATFDLSYRHLPAGRQRLFRYLGLHPGVEIDVYAAAALAGVGWAEASAHLDALHADNLLVEAAHRRYAMHDLIRRYAAGLAAADPAGERTEALDRLVNYYRHTAAAADARLARHTRPAPAVDAAGAPAGGSPDLTDATRALAWMRTERDNLLACIAATSDPGQLVALTAGLAELLRRDGPWTESAAAHRAAADAAARLDDRLGRANALVDLATVERLTGEYSAAERAGQQALEIYRDLCDRLGEANALCSVGNALRWDGSFPAAGQALQQALEIYRDLGDRRGQADALTWLGTVWYTLDDYAASTRYFRDALSLSRELGDRLGEANALTFLGVLLRVQGDYLAAVHTLHEALGLHRDLDDRLGQANTLKYLGAVYCKTGDYLEANQVLKESLDLCRDLGDRIGAANSLEKLAEAGLGSGNHPGAMQAAQESFDLYRELDHRRGQANALLRLGQIRLATGDHPGADRTLRQALDIYRHLGDRAAEAEVLSDLGAMHRLAGDLGAAREHHLQAVRLARQINSQWDEAHAWAGLGRCDLAAGQVEAAVGHLSTALAIFRRIGAVEAAGVAAEIDAIEP